MATAVRISVSLPGDLYERLQAAGLSPSALLAAAARHELGDGGQPSAADRLAAVETQLVKLSSRLVRTERELGRVRRQIGP